MTTAESDRVLGLDDGMCQRFLGGEVKIERPSCYAGMFNNVAESRTAVSVAGKDFSRTPDNLVPRCLSALLPDHRKFLPTRYETPTPSVS